MLDSTKAETLSTSTLNRYYFDIVKTLLEINEGSYVSGIRIWEKEIPWEGHGVYTARISFSWCC